MRELYELYVVCRRKVVLGAPPPAIRCVEEPRIAWPMVRPALPFSDEPVQVLQLLRDGGDDAVLRAFARACADAGDGVVLSAMPVRAPPVFEIEHDGCGAAAMDWVGILAKSAAYQQAARRGG